MSEAITESEFKVAMRNLAAGVTLITSVSNDLRRGGMTATAVSSLSASPPTLLVCVNRSASSHELIESSRKFCVNVLAKPQVELATAFGGALDWESRFAFGRWGTLQTGAPVLQDALAAFDCELADTFTSGSHSIFVGRVVGVRHQEVEAPLMYFRCEYGEVARIPKPSLAAA